VHFDYIVHVHSSSSLRPIPLHLVTRGASQRLSIVNNKQMNLSTNISKSLFTMFFFQKPFTISLSSKP
jgi:hypothetical protein